MRWAQKLHNLQKVLDKEFGVDQDSTIKKCEIDNSSNQQPGRKRKLSGALGKQSSSRSSRSPGRTAIRRKQTRGGVKKIDEAEEDEESSLLVRMEKRERRAMGK